MSGKRYPEAQLLGHPLYVVIDDNLWLRLEACDKVIEASDSLSLSSLTRCPKPGSTLYR